MPPRAIPLRSGRAQHVIDLFPGDDEGPIVVFIHGGYWQALDGSSFSHLAAGLNAHGISVAIPSYDLCPGVTVDDIIRQMRMATRELARLGRPLVMTGHSAGGHLAACMLATDWPAFDASLPEDLVVAAYAISGLFDLGAAGRNLHQQGVASGRTQPRRAASPLFWNAPARGSLDAVVGENESAEYFRQSRTIVERLGRGRRRDPLRHGSRRQPFHRDCAAGRSGLADGAAPKATGEALGLKKRWMPGFGHLRQITLSIKCLGLKRCRTAGYWSRLHPENEGRWKCQVESQP